MKFDELLSHVGDLPWFDLPTLTQLSGENRTMLANQLYRWTKSGKIRRLRRSMYALGEKYRRVPFNAAALANALYRPSYLSDVWALSFYGLIPEGVSDYTSITSRVGRRFSNDVGEFVYTHIKMPAFFGYEIQKLDGFEVLVAGPEKALLDNWYEQKGEWTTDRIEQMRYQNTDQIDYEKLDLFARRFDSPRLMRALAAFKVFAREQVDGTLEL